MPFKLALLVALSLLALVSVHAECPKGCSGAGNCQSKDMCVCHKNRMGNDCSQQICPFGRSHVDTPLGDLNFNGGATDTSATNQMYPSGVNELYPTDTADEGHFYSQCSGRGICDYSIGECECFDGFEGSACQRAACPKECSGHGSCESIMELASDAAGTLYGDSVTKGASTYNLWDSRSTYGCRCDPRFYGPDCSLRRCREGVDPMYQGTPQYETQYIRLTYDDDGGLTGSGTFRLRFFDHWGESYITSVLTWDLETSPTAAQVESALQALPNSVVPSVDCYEAVAPNVPATVTYVGQGLTASSAGYTAQAGIGIACTFSSNPGTLRLMEFVDKTTAGDGSPDALITGTASRGEDEDWATSTLGTATVTLDAVTTALALDTTKIATSPATATVSTYRLARINGLYTVLSNNVGGNYNLLDKWPAATTTGTMYFSSGTFTSPTTIVSWALGAKSLVVTASSGDFVRGKWIYYSNHFYMITYVLGTALTVDRPFVGTYAASGAYAAIASGTPAIYVWTPPTTTYKYVDECAGRGICDDTAGICQCFKGYTGDNCATQNILSV